MTDAAPECAGDHAWHALDEDEMKTLRVQARSARPPGSWVEGAETCERCGRVEAIVSWFGQLHRLPFAPREAGGEPAIHWPTRSGAPDGGVGMGEAAP